MECHHSSQATKRFDPSSPSTTPKHLNPSNSHQDDSQTSIHLRKTQSHIYHKETYLITTQAFRQVARPIATRSSIPRRSLLTPLQLRLLSDQTRAAIDKAVATTPVVLFMKGTPETPQCGFSRATIQILGVEGVDPEKFTAYNVLEDEELRSGTLLLSQTEA
jgi:hypothetical protein